MYTWWTSEGDSLSKDSLSTMRVGAALIPTRSVTRLMALMRIIVGVGLSSFFDLGGCE